MLAALFFAGTRFRGEMPGRIAPLVIALGLALFLARTASTAVRWQALDAQIAEFREALSDIREGASLLLVTVGPADHAFRRAGGGSLLHVADYATIDRSAFVPTVFADPGVQPIHLTDHYWENHRRVHTSKAQWDLLPAMAPEDAGDLYTLAGWQKKYDYVAALNVFDAELAPNDCLVPIHSGSFFTLFEVVGSIDPAACRQ